MLLGRSAAPWDALIHEAGVSGFDRLRDTHYINPCATRSAYSGTGRCSLEIALDIRYYRDLAAAIDDWAATRPTPAAFGTWLTS